MAKLNVNGRTIYAAEFKSRSLAESAMSRAVKTQHLILSDRGTFWMVRPADAQYLERVGYEYAD